MVTNNLDSSGMFVFLPAKWFLAQPDTWYYTSLPWGSVGIIDAFTDWF
jgi:hypothetical protein